MGGRSVRRWAHRIFSGWWVGELIALCLGVPATCTRFTTTAALDRYARVRAFCAPARLSSRLPWRHIALRGRAARNAPRAQILRRAFAAAADARLHAPRGKLPHTAAAWRQSSMGIGVTWRGARAAAHGAARMRKRRRL